MDNHSLITEETISNKIYFIRGQKVMLDRDLALLYGIETKRLKSKLKGTETAFLKILCLSSPKKNLKIGGRNLRPPILKRWVYDMLQWHLQSMEY
jgi:hypothetical protein